jgi:hypothetical protein
MKLDQLVKLAQLLPAASVTSGLPVYMIARITLDRFYRSFGTTPEEVGLSQASILAQAALYLGVAVTCFLALGLVLLALHLLFAGHGRRVLLLAGLGFACVAGIAAAAFENEAPPRAEWSTLGRGSLPSTGLGYSFAESNLVILILSGAVSIATFVAKLLLWLKVPIMIALGSFGFLSLTYAWFRLRQVWILGADLLVLLIVLGFFSSERGRKLARRVQGGEEVRGLILSYHSERVSVVWVEGGTAPSVQLSRPWMYLGQGERWLVLYDTENQQTLRLPAGKAAITWSHKTPEDAGAELLDQ